MKNWLFRSLLREVKNVSCWPFMHEKHSDLSVRFLDPKVLPSCDFLYYRQNQKSNYDAMCTRLLLDASDVSFGQL